jgi:hypothetical protein
VACVFEDMISSSVDKVSFTGLTTPIDVECEDQLRRESRGEGGAVNLNGGSHIATINPQSNAKECSRLYPK